MKRVCLLLVAVLVLSQSACGQFMLDMGEHFMDMIEQPVVRAENIIVDARVYEYVDYQDANLQKLEEMVRRDDEKFLENIVKPAQHQQEQQQQEQQQQQQHHVEDQIHLGRYEFHDPDGRYDNFYDSLIFVEFGHNVDQDQVKMLFKYLALETLVPIEAFQELSINKNAILFRMDKRHCEPIQVINSILKHQFRILQELHLRIVSCEPALTSHKLIISRDWDESHLSNHRGDESSNLSTLVLLTLIIAPVVIACLLGAAICMVRRRRMLMRRDEDEEGLIKSEAGHVGSGDVEESAKRRINFNLKTGAAFLRPSNWTKIVKRSPPTSDKSRSGKEAMSADDYQDLCRQRMESNTEKCSPISSTMCTNLSSMNTPGIIGINSSTINSTPIRITNDGKASNSDSERNSS